MVWKGNAYCPVVGWRLDGAIWKHAGNFRNGSRSLGMSLGLIFSGPLSGCLCQPQDHHGGKSFAPWLLLPWCSFHRPRRTKARWPWPEMCGTLSPSKASSDIYRSPGPLRPLPHYQTAPWAEPSIKKLVPGRQTLALRSYWEQSWAWSKQNQIKTKAK